MTNDVFARKLGWSVNAIGARLHALGLTVPCSRCGGTGHYSFNQMDGTRCFKCRGSRVNVPALTAKLAARAAELVAAGGLVEYEATLIRRRDAKRAMPGLVEACKGLYSVIANDYSSASQNPMMTAAELVASSLYAFQTRANRLMYGDHQDHAHPRFLSVWTIDRHARDGALDLTEARRLLEARRIELEALVREYRRSKSTETP